MNLSRHNILVLDLETLRSADDCRVCGQDELTCDQHPNNGHEFTRIGWNDKLTLGLSIGAYWDYQDDRIHWFDGHTLEATMRLIVDRQPLLVSFNGVAFDFPLMEGLLRNLYADMPPIVAPERQESLTALCDAFEGLCDSSYDLLRAIWEVDPARKFARGLNSLDVIAQANGLGAKLSHGAQAPRDWRDGKVAQVLNYCQDDVYKTKALFELVCAGQAILRGDGLPITLPMPVLEGGTR